MDAFATRFAPSPNGYLHLGHAYSALTVHHYARARGTLVRLRIDDIDTSRARDEFADAIHADLAWLGITWLPGVRYQSEHLAAYDAAAKQLTNMGLTYPCFCTRASLILNDHGHYAGTCRDLPIAEAQARIASGEQAAIRLNAMKALQQVPRERLHYMDNDKRIAVDNEALDDCVIVRKDIGSSYVLSCVVDDAAQHITHVIRGQDIQPLTAMQVLLQALLNLPTPHYIHHELLMESGMQKLSKSKGSTSLRELRDQGVTAQQIWSDLGFGKMGS